MIKKRNMLFLEGEEGGGFGGGESQGAESQHSSESSQTQTAPSPGLDPKAFAQEFGSVIAEQFKKRDEQVTKRPPTAEEIAAYKKQLNYWEPTDEFFTRFDNMDSRKAAFQEMLEGLTNQQATIMRAMLAQQDQQWEQKFQPVHQMLTQREESERVSRFHNVYPTLAKPGIQPLIQAVGTQLSQQGKFQGLSEAQAFTELAKGVEAVIKETNPEFTLEHKPSPTGRSGNSIPASGAGGGGGSGKGAGSGPAKPSAVSILGDVKIPTRK